MNIMIFVESNVMSNKDATMDLSIDEAIFKDIAAFSGTEAELSVRVCGSKQALSHKKAHVRNTSFTPNELIALMLNTGSRHIMHTMAALLGGVFLELPENELRIPQNQEDLQKRMMEVMGRLGDLCDCMREAQKDNVIDQVARRELLNLEHSVRTAMAEWIQLSFLMYPEDMCHENGTAA